MNGYYDLNLFLTTSSFPLAFKQAPGSFNKNDKKILLQPWATMKLWPHRCFFL